MAENQAVTSSRKKTGKGNRNFKKNEKENNPMPSSEKKEQTRSILLRNAFAEKPKTDNLKVQVSILKRTDREEDGLKMNETNGEVDNKKVDSEQVGKAKVNNAKEENKEMGNVKVGKEEFDAVKADNENVDNENADVTNVGKENTLNENVDNKEVINVNTNNEKVTDPNVQSEHVTVIDIGKEKAEIATPETATAEASVNEHQAKENEVDSRRYSAFEIFDHVERIYMANVNKSQDVIDNMNLAYSYVRKEQEWIVKDLKSHNIHLSSSENVDISGQDIPPRSSWGTADAMDTIFLLPTNMRTARMLDEYLGCMNKAMQATKKSQLKFLYLIFRSRVTGDARLDDDVHKMIYNEWYTFVQNLDAFYFKDLNSDLDSNGCVDLHFTAAEKVPAVEANALLRPLCYTTDMERNRTSILEYYDNLESAFAAVRPSDYPLLYEILKRKIVLHEMDGKHTILHKLGDILMKFKLKYKLAHIKDITELDNTYLEDMNNIEAYSGYDVYTLFEESAWLISDYETFILTVLIAVSMVKHSDLKYLYASILQGVVYQMHPTYYVDNPEDFRTKCLKRMFDDHFDSTFTPKARVKCMIDQLPDVDMWSSKKAYFSPHQVFSLIPSASREKDLANLRQFLNGVRYAKEFVIPEEMDFLKFMFNSTLVGPIKNLMVKENVTFDDLPEKMIFKFNIRKLRINLNLIKMIPAIVEHASTPERD